MVGTIMSFLPLTTSVRCLIFFKSPKRSVAGITPHLARATSWASATWGPVSTETQPFRQTDPPLHGQRLNVQRRYAHLLHCTHTANLFPRASRLMHPREALRQARSPGT